MLGTFYSETRTPAVWECIAFNPKSKTYAVKLKKIAGRHDVGGVMELTLQNHAENIERGIYIKTQK